MTKNNATSQGFLFADDDPLAAEHREIVEWVEKAAIASHQVHCHQAVDLKALPAGEKILASEPAKSVRLISAALVQVRHWDQQAAKVRATAQNEMSRVNAHLPPGWAEARGRRCQAATVIKSLLRRKLPLAENELLELVDWCNEAEYLSTYHYPLSFIVRNLERFAEEQSFHESSLATLQKFSLRLRDSRDRQVFTLGTAVEQLCGSDDADAEERLDTVARIAAPVPDMAGDPHVMRRLKQHFGMLTLEEDSAATTAIGPDQYPLAAASILAEEHAVLSQLYAEAVEITDYYRAKVEKLKAGGAILALTPPARGRLALAAAERHCHILLSRLDPSDSARWRVQAAISAAVAPLLGMEMTLDRDGRMDLLLYLAASSALHRGLFDSLVAQLVDHVESDVSSQRLTMGERYVLSLVRTSVVSGPMFGKSNPLISKLTALIGDGAAFCLEPGECWADTVNADFSNLQTPERNRYAALFAHMLTATISRPSTKWLKTAAELVKQVGESDLRARLLEWLPLVSKGRSIARLGNYVGDTRGAADTMNDENATILRGLLWTLPTLAKGEEFARQVAAVALTAYKKVPGVGPRAVKVGNAAIYALSQLNPEVAVGQLAMLKVRVKFGTAQKEIEKAFAVAAEALGLSREEIEEMGVPSYGLGSNGRIEETLGDYRVELAVTGASAHLHWFDAQGKSLKSVPTKVRNEYKDDLKELQQSLKDIQGMLPAQRDRIDSMFLQQKSWPIEQWRERYLDHPLVGTIASRLLWCIDQTPVFFYDGIATDVTGQVVDYGKTAEVTLWHPVGRAVSEVIAWRRRLEQLSITQPFKQAHREVYLLTDAERNTRSYSNRYAAHVIRQHQFNALCAARGWKNRLRLMVDDTYLPPYKELHSWGLRAEFWVEGIGDEYGTDTNDSGVYLRLATDQVRFYRLGAASNSVHAGGGGYASDAMGPGVDNINEPVPLEQVPLLVFSEIMRDVDLFVGVSSVGNDPTWQDGGPEGRYRDYWHSYSFGDLSGTAATRKEVLERLIPRLKIAGKCSFSDRFLVVRGSKRTYKIHLGSGNILMEPNDHYLCIVPDRRASAKQDDLFLPFEGDNMLSIILSKALLLADDGKIKDTTILSQIDGR